MKIPKLSNFFRYGPNNWDILLVNNPLTGDNRLSELMITMSHLMNSTRYTREYKDDFHYVHRIFVDILNSLGLNEVKELTNEYIADLKFIAELIITLHYEKPIVTNPDTEIITNWYLLFSLINIGFRVRQDNLDYWKMILAISKATLYNSWDYYKNEYIQTLKYCDQVESMMCQIFNFVERTSKYSNEPFVWNFSSKHEQEKFNQILLDILHQIETRFSKWYINVRDYYFIDTISFKDDDFVTLKENEIKLIDEDPFLKQCPIIAKIRAIEFVKRSKTIIK